MNVLSVLDLLVWFAFGAVAVLWAAERRRRAAVSESSDPATLAASGTRSWLWQAATYGLAALAGVCLALMRYLLTSAGRAHAISLLSGSVLPSIALPADT